ncbi:Lrp/AsnC family transcriptional regulator [Candidatus Woesearchaeota archaeon]|nr:Lrp/AsnC family transcriptional regulator [Candidatus Woesearchaeota archaeon]
MDREKELLLLSHFRRNARESLTRISRKTNIPVSTIFDKLRQYEGDYIEKHTSLLDFRKLGFDLKTHILFKVAKDGREEFQRFLLNHPRVNSVFRINNGYDYLVEAVFTGLGDLDQFFEEAGKRQVEERQEYFVLKDVLREAFLSHRPGFEEVILQEMPRTR